MRYLYVETHMYYRLLLKKAVNTTCMRQYYWLHGNLSHTARWCWLNLVCFTLNLVLMSQCHRDSHASCLVVCVDYLVGREAQHRAWYTRFTHGQVERAWYTLLTHGKRASYTLLTHGQVERAWYTLLTHGQVERAWPVHTAYTCTNTIEPSGQVKRAWYTAWYTA